MYIQYNVSLLIVSVFNYHSDVKIYIKQSSNAEILDNCRTISLLYTMVVLTISKESHYGDKHFSEI